MAIWPAWPLLLCLSCLHLTLVGASVWEHAVLIDAGSTSSRVHVFAYYLQKDSSYAVVQLPEQVYTTAPGLSAYAFDAKTAAKSLLPLIKFAKDRVPADQLAHTPIQLLATGLRSLGNETAEKLLGECRKVLADSGLQSHNGWVRQLSGQLEGLYGFVSRNYASYALQVLGQVPPSAAHKDQPVQEPPKPTAPLTGLLDIGDSAVHLAFTPAEKIAESQAMPLQLPGLTQQLYSHSFEGYGLQSALQRLEQGLVDTGSRVNPCLPKGYRSDAGLLGGSSFEQCLARTRALLPKDKCTFSTCSIGNTYMPKISGSPITIDGIGNPANVLGFKPGKALAVKDLETAARKFCGRDWVSFRREVLKHTKGSNAHVTKTCFSAVYLLTLLRDAFHLNEPNSSPLLLASTVRTPKGDDVDADWVLGALVVEVIETGGKSLSTAGREAAAAAAAAAVPRTSAGAVNAALKGALRGSSEAVAALEATVFCLLLMALMAWLSVLGVGVLPARGAGPGGGRVSRHSYRPLQQSTDIEDGVHGNGTHSNSGSGIGGSTSTAHGLTGRRQVHEWP